jgi:hypothetical protein
MRLILVLIIAILFGGCHNKIAVERTTYFPKKAEKMTQIPDKNNVWIFIMAGQSNMAGRGIVEPKDTVPDKRILTINKDGELILAKEPLHWYETERTGLDCGYSFGKTIIKDAPADVSVLLIPTAVGGSSISQWINDSLYRNVQLMSNFISKVELAKQYGTIKGILWHQGESDTNEKDIPLYKQRLELLFSKFRTAVGDDQLPVLVGELGSFSDNNQGNWNLLNQEIHKYVNTDKFSAVISTNDLEHKGDHLHFDSKGQREMGKRFARTWLEKFNR